MSEATKKFRGWGEGDDNEEALASPARGSMRALRSITSTQSEAFTSEPEPIKSERQLTVTEGGESTSAEVTMVQPTIVPDATVVHQVPLLWYGTTEAPRTTVAPHTTVVQHAIVTDRYTAVPNDVFDKVLKTLNVYDQIVLIRLYRLSRGFNLETCKVGYSTLASSCNISRKQTQISITRLQAAGFLEIIGVEQGGSSKNERGNIYRIKLPAATMAPRTTVARRTTVVSDATVVPGTPNKEHTLKDTHTNTEPSASQPTGMRVFSRFSLAECRRFADSLRSEGITNPGGYATKIHRSGEADELIAAFLVPPTSQSSVDTSQCADCQGTGFYYPDGTGGGVKRCQHQRLSKPS